MTKESQRVALAKLLDWTDIQDPIMFSAIMKTPAGFPPGTNGPHYSTIPDALNDLNVIHEIELKLTGNPLFTGYELVLGKVVPLDRRLIFASAEQRGEAILKTLNLWKS